MYSVMTDEGNRRRQRQYGTLVLKTYLAWNGCRCVAPSSFDLQVGSNMSKTIYQEVSMVVLLRLLDTYR